RLHNGRQDHARTSVPRLPAPTVQTGSMQAASWCSAITIPQSRRQAKWLETFDLVSSLSWAGTAGYSGPFGRVNNIRDLAGSTIARPNRFTPSSRASLVSIY